jgi:hypothetical protein
MYLRVVRRDQRLVSAAVKDCYQPLAHSTYRGGTPLGRVASEVPGAPCPWSVAWGR